MAYLGSHLSEKIGFRGDFASLDPLKVSGCDVDHFKGKIGSINA